MLCVTPTTSSSNQGINLEENLLQDFGSSRPLYILSSNCFASGLLRRPLLFGKPVPKQTGHTSYPRPAHNKKLVTLFKVLGFHITREREVLKNRNKADLTIWNSSIKMNRG